MKRMMLAGATLWMGMTLASSWAQLQPDAPWPRLAKIIAIRAVPHSARPRTAVSAGPYNAGSRTLGSPIVAADGTIYFGATGGVYAVRPNGSLRWRWNAGYSAATTTPAIDANGVVYALVNPPTRFWSR